MKVYDGQTDDDGRCTPSEGKSSHGLWPGELMIFKLHKYYKMTFGKKLQVYPPPPPFKMAAVTKNRNFFNCPLLL
jgi:hypothetical protein